MTDSLSRNRMSTFVGTTTRSAGDSIGVTRIHGPVLQVLRCGWDYTPRLQASRNFPQLTAGGNPVTDCRLVLLINSCTNSRKNARKSACKNARKNETGSAGAEPGLVMKLRCSLI